MATGEHSSLRSEQRARCLKRLGERPLTRLDFVTEEIPLNQTDSGDGRSWDRTSDFPRVKWDSSRRPNARQVRASERQS